MNNETTTQKEMKMNNKNIEKGAAGLTIELSNGQLTLTHLTEGTQLSKCQVAEGTWNELWSAINFIIGKNVVVQTKGNENEKA